METPKELTPIAATLLHGPSPTAYPPCIYFLIKDETVVYVGQALNLMGRVGDHAITGKVFDRVLYLPTHRERLNRMEVAFIRLCRPKYNVHCNDRGPSADDEVVLRAMGLLAGQPMSEWVRIGVAAATGQASSM